MPAFEYKVVPAPKRGKSAKGVRGAEAKFAHALSSLMNEFGADGWEYLRADTLPSEERSGLTSRTTVYHTMLVFRRSQEVSPAPAPNAEDQAFRDAALAEEVRSWTEDAQETEAESTQPPDGDPPHPPARG